MRSTSVLCLLLEGSLAMIAPKHLTIGNSVVGGRREAKRTIQMAFGLGGSWQQNSFQHSDQRIPLFDPADDDVPFGFPADQGHDIQPLTYKFSRASDIELARYAAAKGKFGQLVAKDHNAQADGALVGAIGIAYNVIHSQISKNNAILVVQPSYRFTVTAASDSEGFIIGDVEQVRDMPPDSPERAQRADELERSTYVAMLDLIKLSTILEPRLDTGSSDSPEQDLELAKERLINFRELAVDNYNGDAEARRETLAYMVADMIQVDYEDAVKIISTRDAITRFEVVSDKVFTSLNELIALKMLDGIKTEADRQCPNDYGLFVGAEIVYHYNDEFGWVSAQLTDCHKINSEVVMWTMLMDDGQTEEVRLNNLNKNRWKLISLL